MTLVAAGTVCACSTAPQPRFKCDHLRGARRTGSCGAYRRGGRRSFRGYQQRTDHRAIGFGRDLRSVERASVTGQLQYRPGLGLYIVREIARAHGGEVDVRSDNGETVFAVRLPRPNNGYFRSRNSGKTASRARGIRVGVGEFIEDCPAFWAAVYRQHIASSSRAFFCVTDRKMRDEALTETMRRSRADVFNMFSSRAGRTS